MAAFNWQRFSQVKEAFELGEALRALIGQAQGFGLPEADVIQATEFLEHNESGLAFDTVATQLYEYDIRVNAEFYQLLKACAEKLALPEESFLFVTELVR